MTEVTYVIAVRGVAGPSVRAVLRDVAVSAADDTTLLRRPEPARRPCTASRSESRTSDSKSWTFTGNRHQAPGSRWPGSRISDE